MKQLKLYYPIDGFNKTAIVTIRSGNFNNGLVASLEGVGLMHYSSAAIRGGGFPQLLISLKVIGEKLEQRSVRPTQVVWVDGNRVAMAHLCAEGSGLFTQTGVTEFTEVPLQQSGVGELLKALEAGSAPEKGPAAELYKKAYAYVGERFMSVDSDWVRERGHIDTQWAEWTMPITLPPIVDMPI